MRDYETLAQTITTSTAQFPDSNAAVEYAKRSISKSASSCLLVFDNLDVPAVFEKIKDYLPEASGVALLYVSRHTDISRLGTSLHIDRLDTPEAVELLLTQSHVDGSNQNVEVAKRILHELGYLPLAID
jgi:hypothetical protein